MKGSHCFFVVFTMMLLYKVRGTTLPLMSHLIRYVFSILSAYFPILLHPSQNYITWRFFVINPLESGSSFCLQLMMDHNIYPILLNSIFQKPNRVNIQFLNDARFDFFGLISLGREYDSLYSESSDYLSI